MGLLWQRETTKIRGACRLDKTDVTKNSALQCVVVQNCKPAQIIFGCIVDQILHQIFYYCALLGAFGVTETGTEHRDYGCGMTFIVCRNLHSFFLLSVSRSNLVPPITVTSPILANGVRKRSARQKLWMAVPR